MLIIAYEVTFERMNLWGLYRETVEFCGTFNDMPDFERTVRESSLFKNFKSKRILEVKEAA